MWCSFSFARDCPLLLRAPSASAEEVTATPESSTETAAETTETASSTEVATETTTTESSNYEAPAALVATSQGQLRRASSEKAEAFRNIESF